MSSFEAHWPLGDSSWKNTTDEIKWGAGISHYALYEQSWASIYKYALKVYVVAGRSGSGRKYGFKDQTGEEYALNVYSDGEHSVCFGFDGRPEIVTIVDSETRTQDVWE